MGYLPQPKPVGYFTTPKPTSFSYSPLKKPRAVESQGNISRNRRGIKSEYLKKQPNLKKCDQALQPCHPKEPMRPGQLDQPLLLLSTRNLTSCSNKPKKSMHSSCANSPLQQISRTWPAVLLPTPQQLLLPTLVYPAATKLLYPAAALKLPIFLQPTNIQYPGLLYNHCGH